MELFFVNDLETKRILQNAYIVESKSLASNGDVDPNCSEWA